MEAFSKASHIAIFNFKCMHGFKYFLLYLSHVQIELNGDNVHMSTCGLPDIYMHPQLLDLHATLNIHAYYVT